MNAEHDMAKRCIAKYIVEGQAAEALANSRSSWHHWSCGLSPGTAVSRISVAETPEEAIEQIRSAASVGLEPRVVVRSIDSPLFAAAMGRDLPDFTVLIVDTDPGGTVDLLRHPDDWLMEDWERFCTELEGWAQRNVDAGNGAPTIEPRDPAIRGAVAEAFVGFVRGLPEPERMRLTPSGDQLGAAFDDGSFWALQIQAFERAGLEHWRAEYLQMLGNRRAWLRALGAQGLGHLSMRDDATLEQLRQAREDSDAEVRAAVERALDALQSPGPKPPKRELTRESVWDKLFTQAQIASYELIDLLRSAVPPHGAGAASVALAGEFASGRDSRHKTLRVDIASADGKLRGNLSCEPNGEVMIRLFGEAASLAGQEAELVFFRSDATPLIDPVRLKLKPSRTGQGVVGSAVVDFAALDVVPEDLKWDLRVLDSA
jgi:hypothetical protein